MKAQADLPPFVCDLVGSPPRRGGGLNLWFYRVARVLHCILKARSVKNGSGVAIRFADFFADKWSKRHE
jgi:hypothetical protein